MDPAITLVFGALIITTAVAVLDLPWAKIGLRIGLRRCRHFRFR